MRPRRYNSGNEPHIETQRPEEFISGATGDDAAQAVALGIRDTGMENPEAVIWEILEFTVPLMAVVILFVIGIIVILLIRKTLIDFGLVEVDSDSESDTS